MVSPWPPSTKAVTFSTETRSSWAMKVRKRAESSTPGHPDHSLVGEPRLLPRQLRHGVERVGDQDQDGTGAIAPTTCSTTLPTISAFLNRRSSRLMPGLRARPAVITTMSEPAVSS